MRTYLLSMLALLGCSSSHGDGGMNAFDVRSEDLETAVDIILTSLCECPGVLIACDGVTNTCTATPYTSEQCADEKRATTRVSVGCADGDGDAEQQINDCVAALADQECDGYTAAELDEIEAAAENGQGNIARPAAWAACDVLWDSCGVHRM